LITGRFLADGWVDALHLIMKLRQVKSGPQNRRISNIECRRVGSLRSVIFYKIDRIPLNYLFIGYNSEKFMLIIAYAKWTTVMNLDTHPTIIAYKEEKEAHRAEIQELEAKRLKKDALTAGAAAAGLIDTTRALKR
jgi:hypothetical protein